MLQNRFDPQKPMKVAMYARMSSDLQNERSPDQQFDTIRAAIDRDRRPWTVVGRYRDDAISGRYTTKRPGFQQLFRDIRSGKLQIDALLVDTFERFSRAKDATDLRRKLAKLGVLVLTVDSNFMDPTSVTGEILSVVESVRAREHGRITAHNVRRGKRDAAKLKHWPGGPVPFGFRLKSVLVTRKGVEEVDHRILEPDPETAWIVRLMFDLADKKGWGTAKIAKHLNDHPEISNDLKPFNASTIGTQLDNAIYVGELIWERQTTDVVDDRRVVEDNPEDHWLCITEFCEPIVDRDVWERVQALRRERGIRLKAARSKAGAVDKFPHSGIALKYPLTGLVRCAECGRAMTPSSGGKYTTKNGDHREYVAYVCPASQSGSCENAVRISESWLREVVFELVRKCLLGDA